MGTRDEVSSLRPWLRSVGDGARALQRLFHLVLRSHPVDGPGPGADHVEKRDPHGASPEAKGGTDLKKTGQRNLTCSSRLEKGRTGPDGSQGAEASPGREKENCGEEREDGSREDEEPRGAGWIPVRHGSRLQGQRVKGSRAPPGLSGPARPPGGATRTGRSTVEAADSEKTHPGRVST